MEDSEEMANRLRQSLDRYHAATAEWVSATLDLASELWNARQMHPNNKAFGIWLIQNDLDDLHKNARAALIGMGQHLDETRLALEQTNSRSLELIWTHEIMPGLASSDGSEDAATSQSGEYLPPEKPKRAGRAPAEAWDRPLTRDERAKLVCRGHIIQDLGNIAQNRRFDILKPSVEEAFWLLGHREPITIVPHEPVYDLSGRKVQPEPGSGLVLLADAFALVAKKYT
jgi:hypothetical protein